MAIARRRNPILQELSAHPQRKPTGRLQVRRDLKNVHQAILFGSQHPGNQTGFLDLAHPETTVTNGGSPTVNSDHVFFDEVDDYYLSPVVGPTTNMTTYIHGYQFDLTGALFQYIVSCDTFGAGVNVYLAEENNSTNPREFLGHRQANVLLQAGLPIIPPSVFYRSVALRALPGAAKSSMAADNKLEPVNFDLEVPGFVDDLSPGSGGTYFGCRVDTNADRFFGGILYSIVIFDDYHDEYTQQRNLARFYESFFEPEKIYYPVYSPQVASEFPVYIGGTQASSAYIGSTEITEIYKGSTKLWP
jgi:hypothetical protein